MLTVILKRSAEPNVIQLTQENVMRELSELNHSEMLLEDSWGKGLKKVRTPFVCLIEADCTLSASYLSSNLDLMRKDNHNIDKGTGGYLKRAMLSSCLGYRAFANRIYSYNVEGSTVRPNRDKISSSPYHVQIGFVPGAIIRYSSIKDITNKFKWDEPNLVKMSTDLSLHFWGTNRRVQVNPNTTYISNEDYLETPGTFRHKRSSKALGIFQAENI